VRSRTRKRPLLGDDHAARLERFGGGGHDVAAAREIEVGVRALRAPR
jgi:nanoRNase/pAp phosphatase (c-di-AMP/oligoRNAs hydrolase)